MNLRPLGAGCRRDPRFARRFDGIVTFGMG